MGVKIGIDVVTAAAITGGGPTQAITGALDGQTPKAVIVLAGRCVTLGTQIAGAAFSIGFCDGTNQFCNSFASDDNVTATSASADTARRFDNGKLVQLMTTNVTAAAIDGEAALSSVSANTLTLNWTTLPTTAIQVVVIFLYGEDLQAAVGTISIPSVQDTGTTVTGLAFAPNAVLFATALNAYAANGNVQGEIGAMGVANLVGATITQAALGWTCRDGAASTTTVGSTYFADNRCMARMSATAGGTGSLVSSGELTAFTADGFTVTTRDGASPIVAQYLALNTGRHRTWVGFPLLGTNSTGNKSVTTIGWKPGSLFVCGSIVTVTDTVRDNSEAVHYSMGAARIGAEASCQYEYKDAAASTRTRSLTSAKLVVLPDDAGAIDWSATLVSFDSGGFTVNVDDAGTNALAWLFAIEAPASTPEERRRLRGVGQLRPRLGHVLARGARHATPLRSLRTPQEQRQAAIHVRVYTTSSKSGKAGQRGGYSRAGAGVARIQRPTPTIGTKGAVAHFGATLREIGRFRRAALARVRSRVPEWIIPEEAAPIPNPVEGVMKGRLSGPGLVRGKISSGGL
jgi:hypothetical protein